MVGMKLFKSDCAGCHGTPNTASENEANVILYPNAPQFVLHPPRKPEHQLFWIVKRGVRHSGMFAWGGQFAPDSSGKDVSDEKIWTAVTFLTHLGSLPPAVDAELRKTRQLSPLRGSCRVFAPLLQLSPADGCREICL
jgi:mono/diheme cytochrome c family protein